MSPESATVVYADRFVPDDDKRRARETGEEAAAIPFLKRFTVFTESPSIAADAVLQHAAIGIATASIRAAPRRRLLVKRDGAGLIAMCCSSPGVVVLATA
jgi:hypothetical protein